MSPAAVVCASYAVFFFILDVFSRFTLKTAPFFVLAHLSTNQHLTNAQCHPCLKTLFVGQMCGLLCFWRTAHKNICIG